MSWNAFGDVASAQPIQGNPNATDLDPINVEGQPWGNGDYNTLSASSPKLTAPLLDTPQSITVIPPAIIEQQGARNLTEVLRNTPGITFDAGENGFATSTNNFKIRGFDGSDNVFIDGARDSGSYSRDVFNVDRVEVFKGAAGDNGRGGAGGYVNMVTKMPSLQNFVTGEFGAGFDEYQSNARKRGTIDFNHAFASGTALRFNGMVDRGGVPGRDVAEMNAWGVAPSLAFGLGTPLRAFISYEHLQRRDRPDWGVPAATIPGTINFDPSVAGARRDLFYGLRSDFDHTDADAVVGRLEYDISKTTTISNQTRWSQVDRNARYTLPTGYDPVTGLVPTQTQYYDRLTSNLSNQTNLTTEFATGAFHHRLSTGVEVTRETSDAYRFGTQDAGAVPIFNPNPGRGVLPPLSPTERNDINITTLAAYAYDTIKLSERWQITGGLRAEHYNVKIGSRTVAGDPLLPLDGYSDDQTTLSGKVGVVYKPARNGSIYASFGVAHQPPGSYLSNPDISRTGDNAFPGFVMGADPVRSHNYEIGTKWDFFNKRLSTAVALFRTEKMNAPITGLDEGEVGPATLKGYGQQIVQGLEVTAAGHLTDAWQVFGGIAWINSERRHSAYLDAARRRASPDDYGDVLRTSGDELAFTPNVTANLWTTYRLPMGLTIGGGIQYVGSSWAGRPDDANRIIPNGKYGKLPSYFITNLMASYEIRKDVLVRFNVDNVFDEKYAVAMNWPATRATLGIPRTYRLSTSFRF